MTLHDSPTTVVPSTPALTAPQRRLLDAVALRRRQLVGTGTPPQWRLSPDRFRDAEAVDADDVTELCRQGLLCLDVGPARLIAWAPDRAVTFAREIGGAL
jgi:hypothetical protein